MLLRHRNPIGCRFTAARSRRALSGIDTYYYSNSRHPEGSVKFTAARPNGRCPLNAAHIRRPLPWPLTGRAGRAAQAASMTASGRRPLSRSALATANALRTRHGPILPSSVSQLPVMITREFERGGDKTGSLSGGTEGSNPLPPVESQARTSAPLIPFCCFCRESRA